MTAGIPGIGIGALFYVISALLMVVLELYRTIRGRSSLARWRIVGRQATIATCIISLTVVALWCLHLIVPAGAYLDIRLGNAQGTGAGAGPGGPLVAVFITILELAWPILGTLVVLTLVLCLAEALPWVAGRPQSLPGKLRFGERLAPRKQGLYPPALISTSGSGTHRGLARELDAGTRAVTVNISPGSQDGDRFDIEIKVAADDPVRITGNPVSD